MSMIEPLSTTPSPRQLPAMSNEDRTLMKAARELEASFLAEMLKAAGLDKAASAFGGGVGEEQFSSFLRLEQSRAMVDAGGIGLAQVIFEAMKESGNGNL